MRFAINFKRPKHRSKAGFKRIIIGPLSLWSRLHSNGELIDGYCLAAWHWENSITWSWTIWWYWPKSWKKPFGEFSFATQNPVWK